MSTDQNLENKFQLHFVVTDKAKPIISRSSKGLLVRSQNLFLRAKDARDNEGSHKVVFRNDSLSFLKNIQVGDTVQLDFMIVSNKSLTGTAHTNLLPLKIAKI